MKIDSSFLRKNIGTDSYFCQKGLLLGRNRRCLVCFPIPVAFNTSPAAAAAKSLQSCPTLCDPRDSSPSLGFSRQEHWSGLPFPSPMHESESEATQSCPTLSDPMDCSLPGSSVHGIFQARVLEWRAIAFSETPATSKS